MIVRSTIGIVVIGRNEGERLVACLGSMGTAITNTVYVDSGSSDGSAERAFAMGAMVVRLDISKPFTAARARNAGFARLVAAIPELELVQFVDGDCVLDADWLVKAPAFLVQHPDVAVVCGRRRERYPEASIYNQLCDWEWDTAVGDATECGGDCLVRVAAFQAVGGYADTLIAGEEPDMCVRLRERGWRIWRLDAEMCLHDANIHRLDQWWRRAVRSGHAFAEVGLRHKASAFAIWRNHGRRALVWGFVMPLAILLAALLLHRAFLLLLLVYPVQIIRIKLRQRHRGWASALLTVLGKFPEAQGVIRFHRSRLIGRRTGLIEYK